MNPFFSKSQSVFWRLCAFVCSVMISVFLFGCGTQWTVESDQQQMIDDALKHSIQFEQRAATQTSPAAFYITPALPL